MLPRFDAPRVSTAANLFREYCYDMKDRIMAGIICAGWDAVASDLAVFGGVLETELVRLHTLPPDSLQVEFDTFVRMASQSQSTYLLAQVVLLRAQELTPSTVLSRLQQVIRVFLS